MLSLLNQCTWLHYILGNDNSHCEVTLLFISKPIVVCDLQKFLSFHHNTYTFMNRSVVLSTNVDVSLLSMTKLFPVLLKCRNIFVFVKSKIHSEKPSNRSQPSVVKSVGVLYAVISKIANHINGKRISSFNYLL